MKFSSLLAILSLGLIVSSTVIMSAEPTDTMKVLRDFKTASDANKWIAQNDGVMGGVSSGKAEMRDGILYFSGKISLENNGGFAQIYSLTDVTDLSAYSAVRLRVKGDGRVYQFRMATDARFRGSRIAYRADFTTEADEWMEVSIPFDAFAPSFRGRLLSGPVLDLTTVHQIAFLLGDGKAGAFALEVEWIGLEN